MTVIDPDWKPEQPVSPFMKWSMVILMLLFSPVIILVSALIILFMLIGHMLKKLIS